MRSEIVDVIVMRSKSASDETSPLALQKLEFVAVLRILRRLTVMKLLSVRLKILVALVSAWVDSGADWAPEGVVGNQNENSFPSA